MRSPVLKACGVDIDRLRHDLETFIDNRLKGIVTQTPSEPLPTAGFQRVVQRAAVHVQSSGRKEVTGANVLVALFSERDSHAVSFLENQGMTRLDAVDYISHGKAKVPGRARARRVSRLGGGEWRRGRGQAGQRGAGRLLRRPQPEGPRRPRRSADRPRARGRAHHPGAVPAHQEQPALCRRARRRQDGDRRGPGPQDRRGRGARGAEGVGDLRARHGRAAGRHALSRRLRGAAQGRAVGAQEEAQLGAVHRRDPHHHRRRRHVGRLDGCVEPAEALAAVGRAALHRLDHLQGIPQLLREGPRAGPPLPEDRRARALDRRRHRDHEGAEAGLREAPPCQLHRRRHQGVGRAVGALHPRPQAARQGDRRDRRGRRRPDAAHARHAQVDHRGARTSRRSSPRSRASRPRACPRTTPRCCATSTAT